MGLLPAGLLTAGALVTSLGQPTTYLFGWKGTAPASTPATLPSFATAWAASTAYAVGAVIKGSDGAAWGCTGAGTSSATGTGPAVGGAAGTVARLLCNQNPSTILDGTASWLRLSGAAVVQCALITNRDTTSANFVDVGSLATLAAGAGGCAAPNGGAFRIDGCAPETIYLLGAGSSAFSVTIAV